MRKYLSALIAMVFAMALMVPVSAEPVVNDEYSSAYYLCEGGVFTFRLEVARLTEEDAVTDLKISRPDIIAQDYITMNQVSMMVPMGSTVISTANSSNIFLGFRVTGRKAGTCKISFKVNDQRFTKKVKVYPYQNPIRELTYAPAGCGSFQDCFRCSSKAELYLPKTVGSKTLRVAAKKGWKILSLTVREKGVDSPAEWDQTFQNGVSSAKFLVPKLRKNHTYEITMEFQNKKTSGLLEATWTICVGI